MIKLIAAATLALGFATSVEAMPRAPLQQPESMVTQIREGCGVGRVRINGVCVTRRAGYDGYYGRRTYGYGMRPYRYGAYGYGNRRYYGYGAYGRPYRPAVRARAYRRWN
jgi:hypothetical protein